MTHWEEKLRFSEKIVILLIVIPLLVSLYLGYRYDNTTMYIIVLICFALVFVLISSLRLKVRVDEKGIAYRYFPFHTSMRLISWKDIQDCKVIKVNALMDFGGIGLRYTFKKTGYIINSKFGIEIKKWDNTIAVISVSRKAEAEAALQQFKP